MVFPWVGKWRWPSEAGRRASFETVALGAAIRGARGQLRRVRPQGVFFGESARKSLKTSESRSVKKASENKRWLKESNLALKES